MSGMTLFLSSIISDVPCIENLRPIIASEFLPKASNWYYFYGGTICNTYI